jgi:hypothetical protein
MPTGDRLTALHYAARYNRRAVADLLIAAGLGRFFRQVEVSLHVAAEEGSRRGTVVFEQGCECQRRRSIP